MAYPTVKNSMKFSKVILNQDSINFTPKGLVKPNHIRLSRDSKGSQSTDAISLTWNSFSPFSGHVIIH